MRKTITTALAVIATLLCLAVAGVYGLRTRAHRLDNNPSSSDLQYILGWAGLGNSRIVEIVHAYASQKNVLVGDQTKAYSLRLDRFPEEPRSERPLQWVEGPLRDPLVVEAIKTATMFPRDAGCDWFPSADAVNSDRFYLSFPEITAYHGQVEAVVMTAYDRKERILYHADVRW
jgi:hypothetical protein